jgi:hypothetical protein
VVGALNVAQTALVPLTIGVGTGVTPINAPADYALVTRLLCTTSGTCCTTDLCNTMSRVEMSFVSIVMSIALALIGVFKGF